MRRRALATPVLVLVLLLVAVACRRAPTADAPADAAPSPKLAATDAAGAIAADAAAREAASEAPAPHASTTDPFGEAHGASRVSCKGVAGKHVAERDLLTSFVDGDDLLALVNRSPQGQLSPDYAPSDLVDLATGRPASAAECDKAQCLRREAAAALSELMAEMKKQGFPGKVESAYRSYSMQCGTFLKWASKGSFCDATEQSALPGHSQHQLGTTVDVFTEEWAKDERGVFREGFGCTVPGKFLQEHAWDFGFVMPYPIHPDDRHPKQKCTARWDIPVYINPRTGYRFEHWHLRYVGKDAAKRFEKAFRASGPGTPNEITVEQWLRSEKGLTVGDVELPVCDGCNCGACATLAAPGEGTCDRVKGGTAIHLDAHGKPLPANGEPRLLTVKRGVKRWHGNMKRPDGSVAILAPQIVLELAVDVPAALLTQPPIGGFESFPGYTWSSTFEKLAPYPDTEPRAFPPLERAWMIGVEPVPNEMGVAWPWRVGLAMPIQGQVYDRANVRLPARPGSYTLKMSIPSGAAKIKVVLLEGGEPRGEPRALELN
jgi:D-alanyl-D-alanine carboxypeptidase